MKNIYRVILMGLVVLGVVYANTEPEEKPWEKWQYQPLDICKFSVFMEVGYYVEVKDCGERKIELKQVSCEEIDQDCSKFPCYKGSDVIMVRANFPGILSASIDKSAGDKDMLKEVNLYWEDGVNTIKGTGEWEELKLCLEAWSVDMRKCNPGIIEVGEITIKVRPPDDTQSEEAQLEEIQPETVQPEDTQLKD
jgi:hypothetical protein